MKIKIVDCQCFTVYARHCLPGNSYGNYFDPAEDCSHVVDNVPKAKSGVYWIRTANGLRKVSKVMCLLCVV